MLRLPQGKTRTLKLDEDTGLLDRLKKGDQIRATYTEAFMVDVTSPPAGHRAGVSRARDLEGWHSYPSRFTAVVTPG